MLWGLVAVGGQVLLGSSFCWGQVQLGSGAVGVRCSWDHQCDFQCSGHTQRKSNPSSRLMLGSGAVGVLQASAGMQSTLLPSQGGTEANYTNSSLMGQGQLTGTSTAGAPDNMTAHVITLERLAHDLQQHLAGDKSSVPHGA